MTPDPADDAAPTRLPHRPRPADDRPTVRAADVADLISYVQHTLGYAPTDSLAGITLSGRRLGAVLRCDWDATEAMDELTEGEYARAVAEHLCRDTRAETCVVILFRGRGELPSDGAPDDPATDPTAATDRRLAATLRRELHRAGLDLRETWLATGGRTWHVDCPRPGHCPDHGAPLDRVETSVVNTSLIVSGSMVSEEPVGSGLRRPAGSPSPDLTTALMHVLDPGPPDAGAAGSAVHRAEGRREAAQAAALTGWLRDWEAVLDGADLPEDAGTRALLAAGLVRVRWRDCLMASASFTLARAVSGAAWWGAAPPQLAEQFEVEPREVNGILFTSVILGSTRRAPDWDRLGRLREACATLIAEAAGPVAAALQCLVAWVEWARGRGSMAGRILTESHRDHPDYPLGQLLTQVVDGGMICGWASRRETAWSAVARRHG